MVSLLGMCWKGGRDNRWSCECCLRAVDQTLRDKNFDDNYYIHVYYYTHLHIYLKYKNLGMPDSLWHNTWGYSFP